MASLSHIPCLIPPERRWVLTNGELVARGIKMRRHDTPRFIIEFQRNLILTLFDGENCEEVRTEGYAKARELIIKSIAA